MSLRGTGQGGPLQRLVETVSVLSESGLLHPGFLLALAQGSRKYGTTVGGGIHAAATRNPDAIGLVDDRGPLSFGALDRSSNAIARALRERGVRTGDNVGLFARNHRGFVLAQAALDKLGVNTLLLNTGFAAPQLRDVCQREETRVILYDEEFRPIVEAGAADHLRIITWAEGDVPEPTLDQLAASHDTTEIEPPERTGRTTILTSGTTGTPKGARRQAKSQGIDSLVGFLGRIPLRVGQRTYIAAPTFHSWGGAHLLLGAQLGCTVLLRRRFDPEDALATISEHKPEGFIVVPVMLQRILDLGPEVIAKYDTSSLRVVASSGSALPGELALRWMDTFGDNLYNLYGSTEVAIATIATPDELRAAPGTAGRPPRGVTVKLFDEQGKEVPQGATGRIFVANENQFEGYTGGGGKEIIDGLMSSGDVGHFDENGLLFVDGRDDDMIVSGGENVFPREVEDLLANHPDVLEVAVIGVPDPEFGQRLKGFVVRKEGAQADEATLKDYVRSNLARYKVPREIVFLEELPRNPTGKVLKRKLAEA